MLITEVYTEQNLCLHRAKCYIAVLLTVINESTNMRGLLGTRFIMGLLLLLALRNVLFLAIVLKFLEAAVPD